MGRAVDRGKATRHFWASEAGGTIRTLGSTVASVSGPLCGIAGLCGSGSSPGKIGRSEQSSSGQTGTKKSCVSSQGDASFRMRSILNAPGSETPHMVSAETNKDRLLRYHGNFCVMDHTTDFS